MARTHSGIRITTSCVANHYAGTDERIIEFFDSKINLGGLISFRRTDDGRLLVQVYNQDKGVVVTAGTAERAA